MMQTRKQTIQEQLWKQMELCVDKVIRQSGLSNTGNTARGFFNDVYRVVDITGFDKKLPTNFRVTLITISCSRRIDPDKFCVYTKRIAERFVTIFA